MTDEMPKDIYVMRIRDEYIALDKINEGTIDDMSTKYIRADTIDTSAIKACTRNEREREALMTNEYEEALELLEEGYISITSSGSTTNDYRIRGAINKALKAMAA